MGSTTQTRPVAGLIGIGNHQSGTRHLMTSSGETRSHLFQRLRAECVWDDAERLKDQVRAECRNRGETKRQAGVLAWDAIAVVYPVADAVTWNWFESRSYRAPEISTAADVNDQSTALATAWCLSMKLLGSLATRCPEVADGCQSLMAAIDGRLSLEPANALIVNEAAVSNLMEGMVANPGQFMKAAHRQLSTCQSPGSQYEEAVADELRKLSQLMELSTPLIERKWPRIKAWLWGPRSSEVIRYLTRACEA